MKDGDSLVACSATVLPGLSTKLQPSRAAIYKAMNIVENSTQITTSTTAGAKKLTARKTVSKTNSVLAPKQPVAKKASSVLKTSKQVKPKKA